MCRIVCVLSQEKGKYECVAGQLKTAEEMVAMYVELVQSTTAGIIGICNPFRPEVVLCTLSLCGALYMHDMPSLACCRT